jgi:hypothetical protein
MDRVLAPFRGKGYLDSFPRIKGAYKACDFIFRRLTRVARVLPDFLIVGVVKGGTTSFFWNLCQHAQVQAPFLKEINYFNQRYDKGLNWYRAHFPLGPILSGRVTNNFITGEATVRYLYSSYVPERVASVMPSAKILMLLRNPIDRAYSQFQMSVREGHELRTMEEVAQTELAFLEEHPIREALYDDWVYAHGYGSKFHLRRGIYIEFIEHWHRFFPKDQFLILKSEDYFENPVPTLEKAVSFLGLAGGGGHLTSSLRKLNVGNYDTLDIEVRAMLGEFYRPYNQELYEFLGVDYGWE